MKTIIIIVVGGVVLWLVDRYFRPPGAKSDFNHVEFPNEGGDE
jgi:hypothetical protein